MTRARLAFALVPLALLSGCDDLFSPSPRPATVRAVGPAERAGTVGEALAPPPSVEVVDRKGNPVAGVAVTWTVSAEGGTVSQASSRTDSRGVAATEWTLPTRAGRHTVTAAVEGFDPVVFGATAAAGPAARIAAADSVRRLGAQDTLRLGVRAFDRYDNPVPPGALTWTSSDTTVARVDAAGLARTLRPGAAVITTAGGSASARTRLDVREQVASISMANDSVVFRVVGTTSRFHPSARTPDGRQLVDLTFEWSSSDTLVARVDTAGVYRAVGRGTAMVTARYGSIRGTVRVTVTSGVLGIFIGGPGGAILPGTTARIPVEAVGDNLAPLPGQPIGLASSDTTVLTADPATRTVRGVRPGTATVTASSEGVTRSVQVTVAPAAGTLTLAPSPLLVYRGQRAGLTATFLASDGTPLAPQLIRWSSTAVERAFVDSTGTVLGQTVGDAEVAATGGGLTARAAVRVRRLQYASVEVGGTHACGTTTEGDALCWGINYYGQVGVGNAPNSIFGDNFAVLNPRLVVNGRFREVAPGGEWTCALDASGAEHCWGRGYGPLACGQPFRGTYEYRCTGVPVRVSTGPFASLDAGGYGLCELRADGTIVSCRGDSWTVADASLRDPSVGATHACALNAAGAAVCWGSNLAGESGPGVGTSVSTPQRAGGSLVFRQVSAGALYTCGVTPADEAYCWGANRTGQLGGGAADSLAHSTPVKVAGGLAFASVTAGYTHACGITRAGDAYCWGTNDQGALGTGSFSGPESCGSPAVPCSGAPVRVAGDHRWRTLSAGERATCGIATDDALYCWGDRMQYSNAQRWSEPTRMPNQL